MKHIPAFTLELPLGRDGLPLLEREARETSRVLWRWGLSLVGGLVLLVLALKGLLDLLRPWLGW